MGKVVGGIGDTRRVTIEGAEKREDDMAGDASNPCLDSAMLGIIAIIRLPEMNNDQLNEIVNIGRIGNGLLNLGTNLRSHLDDEIINGANGRMYRSIRDRNHTTILEHAKERNDALAMMGVQEERVQHDEHQCGATRTDQGMLKDTVPRRNWMTYLFTWSVHKGVH